MMAQVQGEQHTTLRRLSFTAAPSTGGPDTGGRSTAMSVNGWNGPKKGGLTETNASAGQNL